jgi:hypothetical protein
MKIFSLKSQLVAATAATAFLSAGMASAQESEANDIMMGFNPFSNNASVSAPSYMIGFKINEQLMPFAFASLADRGGDSDTKIDIGGGARMYLGNISNRIRPFAGGALGITSAEDTGFGLGAFFGAEAMITDGISVSGQIGADIGDSGCDACDTTIEIGTANVMFNLYF